MNEITIPLLHEKSKPDNDKYYEEEMLICFYSACLIA